MESGFVKRLVKDTAFSSLGTACTVFFHFLSVVILSHSLERGTLGLYFLILAVVHILTVLGGLGLDLTLVKFLSSGDLQTSFWPTVTLRVIVVSFIAIALLSVGKPALTLVHAEMVPYAGLVALIFSSSNLRDLLYHALQGLRRFQSYAIIRATSALLRVLLLAILFGLGRLTLASLLYIEVTIPLCCVVVQLFSLPLGRISGLKQTAKRWKELLQFGLPLYLNNVLSVIMDRANVLLMGALLTLEGVAFYEIAGKIPDGLLRIFLSFIVVYFPNLAMLHAKGEQADMRLVVQHSLTFSSLTISLVTLGVFLFRETIIVLFFSASYLPASMALFLLTVSFLLRALENLMGYAVVSAGFASVPVKVNAVSSLLLVGSSLLLIPAFGVNGAIASLLIVNVTSLGIFYCYLLRAGIRVDIAGALKPFVVAVAICGLHYVLEQFGLGLWLKLLMLAGYAAVCCLWVREIGAILGREAQKTAAFLTAFFGRP